jgi:two-component system nitrogen regulation response regulator GlnG
MATGREVLVSDLPPELQPGSEQEPDVVMPNWELALALWARQALQSKPTVPLLDHAAPTFERVLITEALQFTGGRRRDAALVLGWGRNTLTRKLKELGLSAGSEEEED